MTIKKKPQKQSLGSGLDQSKERGKGVRRDAKADTVRSNGKKRKWRKGSLWVWGVEGKRERERERKRRELGFGDVFVWEK